MCRQYDKLLDEFSSPKEGTQVLHFNSIFSKPCLSLLYSFLFYLQHQILVCRQYDKLLDEFSSPKQGTQALHFDSTYPKPFTIQFRAVYEKYWAAYWRMPEYNGFRFFYAISVGFLFGAIFWRLG